MSNNEDNTVYWSLLNYKKWHLYIAATDKGLCYVGSPNAPFKELEIWVTKKLPKYHLLKDEKIMKPYEVELIDYIEGNRKSFSIPMDLRGTEFQQKVWMKMFEIPYGHTATYTDIAEQLNRPDAVRAVGTAIGANPMLITLPCHRIFGKNGKSRGYRGGATMKDWLLEIEGIQGHNK